LKHTSATYVFCVAFACCFDESRFVDAELDVDTKLEATGGAEVVGVELVGSTNLGRSKDRLM
jgi:hypothetical protein